MDLSQMVSAFVQNMQRRQGQQQQAQQQGNVGNPVAGMVMGTPAVGNYTQPAPYGGIYTTQGNMGNTGQATRTDPVSGPLLQQPNVAQPIGQAIPSVISPQVAPPPVDMPAEQDRWQPARDTTNRGQQQGVNQQIQQIPQAIGQGINNAVAALPGVFTQPSAVNIPTAMNQPQIAQQLGLAQSPYAAALSNALGATGTADATVQALQQNPIFQKLQALRNQRALAGTAQQNIPSMVNIQGAANQPMQSNPYVQALASRLGGRGV